MELIDRVNKREVCSRIWRIRLQNIFLKKLLLSWWAAGDAILTAEYLCEKMIIFGSLCCIYKESEENTNHILLNAGRFHDCGVWNIVFSLFNRSWVLPRIVEDAITNWKSAVKRGQHRRHHNYASFGGHGIKETEDCFKKIIFCYLSCILRERRKYSVVYGKLDRCL